MSDDRLAVSQSPDLKGTRFPCLTCQREVMFEHLESLDGSKDPDQEENCHYSKLIPQQNVGLVEVADGPIYKVHRYKDHPAGAGEINMAVEDAVRSINRANGAKSADMNVWEVSECIDEYFKPEPEAKISPRCGLSDEWDMVMGRADLANRSVDRRRPNLARPTLMEALDLAHHLANDVGFYVLLTGHGARSPTSQNAFQNLISQDFPMATLHDDEENHMYVSCKMGRNQSPILIR
jgi:hypothetical protein